MKIIETIVTLLNQSKKLINTLSRPDDKEFWSLSKIIFLMIIATGVLGLLIELLMSSDAVILGLLKNTNA